MKPFLRQFDTYDKEYVGQQQAVRLRQHLKYLVNASPYYRSALGELKDHIDDFNIADLKKLPTTTKDDLHRNENAFLCVEPEQIVEYVTTSGTLGEPVTFMLTEEDLQRLAFNEFMSLSNSGCTKADIIQIMVTLDKRFMAGMAYYLGARQIGCGIVRTGVESLDFQIDTILRIRPTTLIAVPSFIVKLFDHALAKGIDLNQSSIRTIICIGESIRNTSMELNPLGKRIVDRWNVNLRSTYASTEMATAFTECVAENGAHHIPELIIIEILDGMGNAVADGQPGQLVVTPMGVTGMPLLRFETGDICRVLDSPCPCGRKTVRLGPVEGRKQQMIKLKGTTLYPPALFDVLNGIEGINDYLITLHNGRWNTDEVMVEYSTIGDGVLLEKTIVSEFKSHLRVVPNISRVSQESLEKKTNNPMSRKSINLLDLRNQSNFT